MNQKYLFDESFNGVQYDYNTFNKYDTIILKSTTGTAKTTSTAKHLKRYITENKETKILCIVTRKSLTNQHIQSFKDQEIILMNYQRDENQNKELEINKDNIDICINSLLMLQKIPVEELKNYVVYIDEIASFNECLTHNNTLDKNINLIYNLLVKIIRNSKKVIVSDAHINDGIFELLKHRKNESKLFLTNEYQKYNGVKATRIKNELNFIDMILQKCINNEPFFYGSDSCSTVTNHYNYCIDNILDKELKQNFILITADTKIKISNASVELKNKFVFYSPSITFGLDYSVITQQDVFIYIKGKSILPSGSFQQTTRTRNIKQLYYFCNCKSKQAKYRNIEDVIEKYDNIEQMTNNLNSVCVNLNENDEEVIVKNSYYNIFCYNEYVKDIYSTNKLYHYENILKINGFELIDDKNEEEIALTKEENNELKELTIEINSELFKEYINTTVYERANNIKFSGIENLKEEFKIKNDELFIEMYPILSDKFKRNELFSFNSFLYSVDDIEKICQELNNTSYSFKSYDNINNKLKVLHQILNDNKLELLNFDIKNDIILSDIQYNLCKAIFRTRTIAKPETNESKLKLIVQLYKNILSSEVILTDIKNKKIKVEGKEKQIRIYNYKSNDEYINKFINCLIKINYINEENITKYNNLLVEKFDIRNLLSLHMKNEELNIEIRKEEEGEEEKISPLDIL